MVLVNSLYCNGYLITIVLSPGQTAHDNDTITPYYFRMSQHQFHYILNLLEDDIKKELTQFRQPISASERLAICLR